MDDKQPLIGAPSAPPYAPPPLSDMPPGAAYPPPQAPPPAYSHPQQPPPPAVYGTTTNNITVVQATPVVARHVVDIKPPNYVIMSVVVLFAFCWVFGLIALLIGLQVDSAWLAGDRARARRLSASARGWNIAGLIAGCFVYASIIVSAVASSAAGA